MVHNSNRTFESIHSSFFHYSSLKMSRTIYINSSSKIEKILMLLSLYLHRTPKSLIFWKKSLIYLPRRISLFYLSRVTKTTKFISSQFQFWGTRDTEKFLAQLRKNWHFLFEFSLDFGGMVDWFLTPCQHV